MHWYIGSIIRTLMGDKAMISVFSDLDHLVKNVKNFKLTQIKPIQPKLIEKIIEVMAYVEEQEKYKRKFSK